jgi:hypothetical protein
MSPRRLTIVAAAVLGALLLAGAHIASAATLGGVSSRKLGAWTFAGGSGAPTVMAWDGFTRTNGTNLAGVASGGGGPAWQVLAGTWITAGNAARDTPSVTNAAMVVDCALTNATVTVGLSTSPGSFYAGLTLKSVASGYLYVSFRNINGGRIDVGRVVGTTDTPIASVTNVGSPSSATLSATYAAGVVTVRFNGVTVLTTTLSAANVTTFGSSTRYGLYSGNDTQTLFDDFRCES